MIEIKEIRLIEAIAEHGSLARTARALGMSQPNLTRALAAMEAKLGGPLFERHRHGVIATNLTRVVLGEAPGILDQIRRLEDMLTDVQGHQDSEIRIAAGAYVGETIGYRAAARMTTLYPRLQLRLLNADWIEVPRALHAREASVGLIEIRGYKDDPSLIVEPLTPQPAVFLVRHGHPLTLRHNVTFSDIMVFPLFFIGRVPHQVQARFVAARDAAHRAGNVYPAFPALIFQSASAAVEQLRHCDSVIGVTPQIGAAALRSGEVVPLRWREPWMSVCPAMVRRRSRDMSETEKAFLQVLQETNLEIEQETKAWFRNFGLSSDCD
jgi:molybdate transport repressor ModE-like protein